jgi:hypothetical protein
MRGAFSLHCFLKEDKVMKVAIVCFDDWPDLDIPPVLCACTRYYVDRPDEYLKLYTFLTGPNLGGEAAAGE